MSVYVIVHFARIIWPDHETISSYIALDQIRCSLLEPGYPRIIERLSLRLPMNPSELGFLRDA